MARIRTLKPEFWQDEKLAPLPPLERLVFLGLISMADDAGRLVDSVKMIDGMLFPLTDDTSRDAIETLARLGRVCRYTSDSGQKCIQIIGWARHQKVDNPAKHVLAAPTPEDLARPPVTDSSRESRENGATISRSDLGPRTMDHGPRIMDRAPDGAAPKPRETPLVVPAVRSTRPKKGAAPSLTDDEEAVLAHYKRRHPHRKPERDPKALKCIANALADYDADELCKAIDGNADDPWHREKRKHDLTYVLRSPGKIDEFVALRAAQLDEETPILLKDPARAYALGIIADPTMVEAAS